MYSDELVSIVIPVHNGERFLHENVECIINQTYIFLEIIYVCDGCTDETVAILQKYSMVDDRINIHIEQERHGAAYSRNIGKGKATGEWIIFLDCDDLFERNMIEKMVSRAVEAGADLCCCFWDTFRDKPISRDVRVENTALKQYSESYPVINISDAKKYVLQLVHHCPWNKLLHKTVYKKEDVVFQEIPNCNDTYFSLVSAIEAKKIVYVDEVLVHYRDSVGRSTLSDSRLSVKNYVWEAYDKLYQYIEQKDDNGELKQSFYNRICSDINNMTRLFLYENLFHSICDIYFKKWGMQNADIQKGLSYFNREIYKKLCTGDVAINRFLMMMAAKRHFVSDTARRGSCSIWGCGYRFCESLGDFNMEDVGIKHLYDSAPDKWGTRMSGKVIEKFNGEWTDYMIVTTSQYYEEIKQQIGNMAGCVYDLERVIFMY